MYICLLFVVILSCIVIVFLLNYNNEVEDKIIIKDNKSVIKKYRKLDLIEFLHNSYVMSVYYDERIKSMRLICVHDKETLPDI